MLVHSRNQLIDQIIKNLDEENSQNTDSSAPKSPCNDKIVLKKLKNRFFKSHGNGGFQYSIPQPRSPLSHVYKLFNTFGINQQALTTPDFEESFMRTYFYHRIVTKVQKYKNAVVINITPVAEALNQPQTGYIIQKLKSYGNKQLYNLAILIEQLWGQFVELKQKQKNLVIQEDKESVTKYLNILGKEMFFIKFGLFKVAISNSLLEYIGYDVDQFCVETIKYRTVMFDFLSSNTYCRIITHALTTLKYLLDVELEQLSPEQYIQLSQFDFLDYIYSRDHKKTYCDMEYSIPVRGIICIKVKKIHYQSSQIYWKPVGEWQSSKKEIKKSVNQKEFELLNRLGTIPSNWLKKSQSRTAGYKVIEESGVHSQEKQI